MQQMELLPAVENKTVNKVHLLRKQEQTAILAIHVKEHFANQKILKCFQVFHFSI